LFSVSIWFYSSRGTNCCLEIRNMIDMGAGQVCTALSPPSPPLSPPLPPLPPPSPPSPPLSPGANATAAFPLDVLPESAGCPPFGPCLGFEGSCADLQEQFSTLDGCYFYGDPGAEEQHEFLADYGARDTGAAAFCEAAA
jgi:hypothetical protein